MPTADSSTRERAAPEAARAPPGACATATTEAGPAVEGRRTVSLPRFRGRIIAPPGRGIIVALPPILTIAAVVAVTVDPEGAAAVIGRVRTFATGNFTRWFVLCSLIALGVCLWLCPSRIGAVRPGGPMARPEHSGFAWHSIVVVLMIVNLIRRLRARDREVRQPERIINGPGPRAEDDAGDADGVPRADPRRGVGPGTQSEPQNPCGH